MNLDVKKKRKERANRMDPFLESPFNCTGPTIFLKQVATTSVFGY